MDRAPGARLALALLLPAVALAVTTAVRPAQAQEAVVPAATPAPARLLLRLEAGSEYDSNVHRDERIATDPPTVQDGLLRLLLKSLLVWQPNDRFTIQLGYTGGGKVFYGFSPSAREEDVYIQQAQALFQVRLHRRLLLGLSGDLYDAYQRVHRRDFRTVTGSGNVTVLIGNDTSLTASAGYRDFTYKPDFNFDFRGDTYGLVLGTRWLTGRTTETSDESEWELLASYNFSRRDYAGPVIVNTCGPDDPVLPDCLQVGAPLRRDLFHEGSLGVTLVRSFLLGLTYGIQINGSNSYGQTLRRHVITARTALRPFRAVPGQNAFVRGLRGLYLTAQATIQYNQFGDKLLVATDVGSQTFRSIEDENRNGFLVSLARDLPLKGMAIEARYSAFTNEFATRPVGFFRQVAYLGLRFDTRFDLGRRPPPPPPPPPAEIPAAE